MRRDIKNGNLAVKKIAAGGSPTRGEIRAREAIPWPRADERNSYKSLRGGCGIKEGRDEKIKTSRKRSKDAGWSNASTKALSVHAKNDVLLRRAERAHLQQAEGTAKMPGELNSRLGSGVLRCGKKKGLERPKLDVSRGQGGDRLSRKASIFGFQRR